MYLVEYQSVGLPIWSLQQVAFHGKQKRTTFWFILFYTWQRKLNEIVYEMHGRGGLG